MADPAVATEPWRIEFTQQDIGPTASMIAEDLRKAGVTTGSATYKPPSEATLGTPEIIITIIVAAAAKALVVSGLHALEQALEGQISGQADRRAQIILIGPAEAKQRCS